MYEFPHYTFATMWELLNNVLGVVDKNQNYSGFKNICLYLYLYLYLLSIYLYIKADDNPW